MEVYGGGIPGQVPYRQYFVPALCALVKRRFRTLNTNYFKLKAPNMFPYCR